jgi:type IV secretory pathway protease TraF
MPQLDGCHTVQAGHLWVMLKDNPLSLDSRYFGEVDEATVYGKASLVWGYQH